MPSAEASGQFPIKDFLVLIPLFGGVLAMTWEVGSFIPVRGFTYFSLSEHLLAAVNALPNALAAAVVLLVGPLLFFPYMEKGAQNLFDPDNPVARRAVLIGAAIFAILGVAVIIAALIFRVSPFIGAGVFIVAASAFLIGRPQRLVFYALLFICSLIVTMGFAVDNMRDYLNSPRSGLLSTIHTKNGVYRGKVIMSGERGLLFYQPDQSGFVFQRQDEIQRIEWPRLKLITTN
jgi:hypothetical protein